jgi:uncharacterized Zn-binding protein involved in type VI secretion
MSSKPAARVGDAGLPHCTAYTIATGSPTVFIDNRPAARVGDITTLHKKPGGKKCIPHVATIATGSSRVFINGKPAARVGDALLDCTVILTGSPTVFIGD